MNAPAFVHACMGAFKSNLYVIKRLNAAMQFKIYIFVVDVLYTYMNDSNNKWDLFDFYLLLFVTNVIKLIKKTKHA